jgi:hypothetical protein
MTWPVASILRGGSEPRCSGGLGWACSSWALPIKLAAGASAVPKWPFFDCPLPTKIGGHAPRPASQCFSDAPIRVAMHSCPSSVSSRADGCRKNGAILACGAAGMSILVTLKCREVDVPTAHAFGGDGLPWYQKSSCALRHLRCVWLGDRRRAALPEPIESFVVTSEGSRNACRGSRTAECVRRLGDTKRSPVDGPCPSFPSWELAADSPGLRQRDQSRIRYARRVGPGGVGRAGLRRASLRGGFICRRLVCDF